MTVKRIKFVSPLLLLTLLIGLFVFLHHPPLGAQNQVQPVQVQQGSVPGPAKPAAPTTGQPKNPAQPPPPALPGQSPSPALSPSPAKSPGAGAVKAGPSPKINYAPDIMKEFMLMGAKTVSYKANLIIKAPDASFLSTIIPESRYSEVQFPVTGEVSYKGELFRITLLLAQGQKVVVTSSDGTNLNVVNVDPTTKAETSSLVSRTPLSAILPFVLRLSGAGESYNLGPADKVDGVPCNIILANSSQRGDYRLWMDIDRKVLRKMEYVSSSTFRKLTAKFRGISSEENKGWFYSGVSVEGEDGKVIYEGEISGLQWNTEAAAAAGGVSGSPPPGGRHVKKPAGPILPPPPPPPPRGAVILLKLFIFAIVCGLAVQGYLLWKQRRGSKLSVSPPRSSSSSAGTTSFFAKEIMVVEQPDSASVIRALSSLGQAAEPYNSDDFSRNLESIRTGSGQVIDAKGVLYKPRIIVVGPNAFPLLKSQLSRLQLYIKEGGKVVLLNHSPQVAEQMPFKVKFYTFSTWEKNLSYSSRINIWRSISEKEVESGSSFITPACVYISVDGKKVAQEIVSVRHGSTQVEGTVVGIIPEGKGEWILCQYRLIEAMEKGVGAAVARNILRDILEYARM